MESYTNVRRILYAPTETEDLYPESDGKPMADIKYETKIKK